MSNQNRARFASNLVLILFSSLLLLFAFSFLTRYFTYQSFQHLVGGCILLAGAGLCLVALFWLPEFKPRLALFLSAVALSLVVSEVALKIYYSQIRVSSGKEIAQRDGIPFDERSPLQVVADFGKEGQEYFLVVQPVSFKRLFKRSLKVRDTEIIPFGGAAKVPTVLCNEGGKYVTFLSDEFGFNNPIGIWTSEARFEVIFVGDSFVQGRCVERGDGFVDRVRKNYPLTLGLGMANNGPLAELGTLKEYLVDRKIKNVFWMYYEGNDLTNLNEEKGEPILLNYLQAGFSQAIKEHFPEIDHALKQFVRQLIQEGNLLEESQKVRLDWNSRIEQIWNHPLGYLIPNVYSLLRKGITSWTGQSNLFLDVDLFESVLREANGFVGKKGGKLVFVYLPSYDRFDGKRFVGTETQAEVLLMMARLGIPVLNLIPAFLNAKDPRSLFTFGIKNHYNPMGNAVVANEILGYLKNEDTGGGGAGLKVGK